MALLNDIAQMFHKRLLDNESANGSSAPGGGGGLYAHMEKIGLHAEMPIRTWFARGFAGVLNEVSLQRIWDKGLTRDDVCPEGGTQKQTCM